jgi:hypothetical protein
MLNFIPEADQNFHPFPELAAWQKLRAEMEPYQDNLRTNVVTEHLDRLIADYDNLAIRQVNFEQFANWLEVYVLIGKIDRALPPGLPQREQQARESVRAWLPDRIVAFTPRSPDNTQCLKNWLYFDDLSIWQELQIRLQPYQKDQSDRIFTQLVVNAISNYCTIQKFIFSIEALSIWMLGQPRIRYILTGATSSDQGIMNALKTAGGQLWAEARLEAWLRTTFAQKFRPVGDSATKSLINLVAKNLHNRISKDLIKELRALQGGQERSLDESTTENLTLLDTIASSLTIDLDRDIPNLQRAEQERRGFQFFQAYLQGLVDFVDTAYRSRWEVRLADYITTDPVGELQDKFYGDPTCNYQYLLKCLILPNLQGLVSPSVSEICRQFPTIPEAGLRTHIDRNFYLWIDAIHLEILDEEEWIEFRAYLEIINEDLITCHRKGFPTCNIFFLTQHRLPQCFPEFELTDWDSLAKVISQADSKKIKPDYVEKYWHEECRPLLGKIARQQILEYGNN